LDGTRPYTSNTIKAFNAARLVATSKDAGNVRGTLA